MKQESIRALYIGLHPHTLAWLNQPPLSVIAVSKLDFLYQPTFNPANLYFQVSYALVERTTNRLLRTVLYLAGRIVLSLTTGVYSRYKGYLLEILRSDIRIVDAEDEEKFCAFIQMSAIDILVINSWSLISKGVISSARLGAINVHPSKLPQYRGALPTLWSLKNKDDSSAVTFIVLTEGVDDGGVVAQYGFKIEPTHTSLDVEHTIDQLISENLHKDVVAYVGTGISTPQYGTPTQTGKYVSYAAIDWATETARDIRNKVLLYPYLEPYFYCHATIAGHATPVKDVVESLLHVDLAPGHYLRTGLLLHIGTAQGVACVRLFNDINFAASITVLVKKSGDTTTPRATIKT